MNELIKRNRILFFVMILLSILALFMLGKRFGEFLYYLLN